MSSKKAETKRNGVKRCGEETSSQGSSTHPKTNTQTRKMNTKTRKISQFFSQTISKKAETKRRRVKRCREETSSQGSGTHPEINTQTRKFNTQTRKINTKTRKINNKEIILLEDFNLYKNACGKCDRCCCLRTPTFPTSDERSGDSSSSTFSKRSISSMETTAASKKKEVMAIDQLSYLYNNGKLNDGDLKKALKQFKEDTIMRDVWLRLKEELQVTWFKEDV